MNTDQTSVPPTTNHPPLSNGQLKPTAILEPIEESVSVHIPWYKRFFVSGVRTETVWRLSFIVLLVMGFFIGRAIQIPQTTTTRAGSRRATISIKPIQTHLPPDTFVQVWVTTDATLTSGRFDIRFDPAKVIILDAQPGSSATTAGKIIITSASQANIDGELMINFSQVPAKNVNTLTSTFELVNITFHAKSTAANDSTDVTLVSQNTKLLHDTAPFTISSLSNATLLLNSK